MSIRKNLGETLIELKRKIREWRTRTELRTRFKYTLEFVKKTWELGETLDIGDENEFGKMMCKELGVEYKCTGDKDLDYHWFSFPVDNVFCFEIIEHLLNPLLFLDTLKNYVKPQTKIYLSYPNHILNWTYLWHRDHFNEYSTDRFKILLDKAGYEIVRHKTRYLWLIWRSVFSFRFPLNLITGRFFKNIIRNHLYELKIR